MVRAKTIVGIVTALSTVLIISTVATAPTEEKLPEYIFEPPVLSRELMERKLEPEIAEPIEWMNFEATAYSIDTCDKAPEHPLYGITSTGVKVKENHTIAVDPSVIPYGSIVYIKGLGIRYAEDCGSAIKGNEIDIYMSSTKEAIAYGRQAIQLYIMEAHNESD